MLKQSFLKDSREMAELSNHSADIVLTSSPYFNIKNYSKKWISNKANMNKA
jgi:DNA modification methylase